MQYRHYIPNVSVYCEHCRKLGLSEAVGRHILSNLRVQEPFFRYVARSNISTMILCLFGKPRFENMWTSSTQIIFCGSASTPTTQRGFVFEQYTLDIRLSYIVSVFTSIYEACHCPASARAADQTEWTNYLTFHECDFAVWAGQALGRCALPAPLFLGFFVNGVWDFFVNGEWWW